MLCFWSFWVYFINGMSSLSGDINESKFNFFVSIVFIVPTIFELLVSWFFPRLVFISETLLKCLWFLKVTPSEREVLQTCIGVLCMWFHCELFRLHHCVRKALTCLSLDWETAVAKRGQPEPSVLTASVVRTEGEGDTCRSLRGKSHWHLSSLWCFTLTSAWVNAPAHCVQKVKKLPATARRRQGLLQCGGIRIWEPPTNSHAGINSLSPSWTSLLFTHTISKGTSCC